MKYGILILFSMVMVVVNCAKPIALREANKLDEKKERSINDYPANAKSGHCYVKSTVPATYKKVTEQVLVAPATTKVEQVPAEIEIMEEKVIDKPGSSSWKKSLEGDLYCYEEIPPTFKTIRREVVKAPATSKVVEVPAEYKTVTKDELVQPEKVEWTEVLCGNNAKPIVIERIQKSLKRLGYSPGRVDGTLDEDTMEAINKYQRDKKLKVNNNGLIYMETAESLGVLL